MKSPFLTPIWQACLASLLIISSPALASDAAFAGVETRFRELPMDARRLTGPLFWLHGDDARDKLQTYVGKVFEGGNGSFTPESRPHTDWLGAGWWRDLEICLESAKNHDLQMWIFDEKWWPSQAVAGKVPSRYAAKRLEAETSKMTGPGRFQADGYAGESYVAAIAGKVNADGRIDGASLVDLAPYIRQGKLSWQAPPGAWHIMKFTVQTSARTGAAGRPAVIRGRCQQGLRGLVPTDCLSAPL